MPDQSQAIGGFINKLIEEKQLGNLEAEVREQLESGLSQRIERRINAVILENMPADKLEDFDRLLDVGDSEEIQKFCHENIFNLEELIAQALIDFREVYLKA